MVGRMVSMGFEGHNRRAAEDFEGVLPRAFYVVADGLVEIRPPNTKGLKRFNARRGVEYRITLSQIGANSAVDIVALW